MSFLAQVRESQSNLSNWLHGKLKSRAANFRVAINVQRWLHNHPATDRERHAVADLERFRQEEADHRDLATDRGGTETAGYGLLRGVIRRGCKTAIWLSERL